MQHDDNRAAEAGRVLSRVRALQRSRGVRDSSGQFWIEGVRQFVQACDAGIRFETVVISRVLLQSDLAEKLSRKVVAGGVRRVRVTPEAFRSISTTEHASGIGAIVHQPWMRLQQVNASDGLCWLVVESIRSPGNLGTIIRTAEATGAAGVIFLSRDCDPFNPAVVRASMGGLFHLKLIRASIQQFREWSNKNNVTIVGLSPHAERLWSDISWRYPVALMLGEERKGLSTAGMSLCHTTAKLPMTGYADSLNVAVATGVMLYELVRRKGLTGADAR